MYVRKCGDSLWSSTKGTFVTPCKSIIDYHCTLLMIEGRSLPTRVKVQRSQVSLRMSTLSHIHMEDTVRSYCQEKPLSRNILSASLCPMAKGLYQQRRGSISGSTIQFNTTSKSRTLALYMKTGCQPLLAIGKWRMFPTLRNLTKLPTRLLKMKIPVWQYREVLMYINLGGRRSFFAGLCEKVISLSLRK